MAAGYIDPVPIEASCEILDEASVSLAREYVRAVGAGLPFGAGAVENMALVASELAHNVLMHAQRGSFAIRRVDRGGVEGIEIVVDDKGDGLGDPARAFEGRRSTAGGLGGGLPAVRRIVDELDLDTRLFEGTSIRARKFVTPPPFRTETAVLGRMCQGEEVSGDDAVVSHLAAGTDVVVVDGLGHGPLAREASSACISEARRLAGCDPAAILSACDEALRERPRGAVLSIARIDRVAGEVEYLGLGDVNAHIYRPHEQFRFDSLPGIVGAAGRHSRRRVTAHQRLGLGDIVVVFTDGLMRRMDIRDEFALLREHPAVIAQHLMENFARGNDDALIVVSK